jgi:hypothetical protein
MTSSQKSLIDSLGYRISKEEAIGLSFEIINDHTFAAKIVDLLKSGNAKKVSNILWSLRNLQEFKLKTFPDLPLIVLDAFEKFPLNESILRDGVGLLQVVEIPDDIEGQVFDTCFGFLQDTYKSIAVKAFSMTVCHNLAKKHPELLKELEIQIKYMLLIQGQLSPAIYSRGNAILKKINPRLHK